MPSKLTKRIVDALPPGAVAWDSEIRGFGCRRSKGGAASYVLKYRAGGRQRWLTIGRHGAPWTPDAARKTALEALAEVARGGDPATAKREAKLTEAIAEFAERYTAEYARLHKKPTSLDADRYHLKNHILPKLGRIDLTDLSRRDVAKFHSSLHDRPYTANRCLALLSHMCAVAERWGARPDGSNPCRHVKKFKEKKRERFLSPEELGRLGEALVAEDARGGSLYT
ncbi:MAG: integrase arm-type DNA-binding domain-containing protein, partial [Pseudomonadota bacterium]